MLNHTKGLTINQRKYHGNLKGGAPSRKPLKPPRNNGLGLIRGIMKGSWVVNKTTSRCDELGFHAYHPIFFSLGVRDMRSCAASQEKILSKRRSWMTSMRPAFQGVPIVILYIYIFKWVHQLYPTAMANSTLVCISYNSTI